MTIVTRSAMIDAPPGAVWRILTELDRYEEWETGYVSSSYTGEQREGVGTTRRVELRSPIGVRYAVHEVTRWEEGAAIAWAARDTNFPMLAAAEQTVGLRPDGQGTFVENRVEYELRYGVLGSLADLMMMRRTVRGAAKGFLAGLKRRAEAGGA